MAIAFRDSASYSSTGTTIAFVTTPSTVQSGDVMVLSLGLYGGSGEVSPTTPGGWTLLGGVTGTGGTYSERLFVWTRTADGTDAGTTVTVPLSGTGRCVLVLVAYSGAVLDVSASQISSTDGVAFTSPSVTTTVGGCQIVEVFGVMSDAAVSPTMSAPATLRCQQSDGQFLDVAVCDQSQATAGPTGTQSAAVSSSPMTGSWASWTIALTPGLPGSVVAGPTATLTFAATAGTIDSVVQGATAGLALLAPAGSFVAAGAITVVGATAAWTLVSPAGTLAIHGVAPIAGSTTWSWSSRNTSILATLHSARSAGWSWIGGSARLFAPALSGRWQFINTVTGVAVVLGINPNLGGSPKVSRRITELEPTAATGTPILMQGRAEVPSGQFEGVVLTEEQCATLTAWAGGRVPLLVVDDLGRQQTIVPTGVTLKRGGLRHAHWRHTYTVTYLQLDRAVI